MSGLIPAEMLRNLPQLYATEKLPDPVAQVKLFTPWTGWTWYLLEYDGEDLAFAWVEGQESELGYVSLKELEEIRGPGGLRIECDLHFRPTRVSQLRHVELAVRYAEHERER